MFEIDDLSGEPEFAVFDLNPASSAGRGKAAGGELLRSGAIEDITGLNLPAALGSGGALSKNGQLVKRTLRSLVGSDDPKTFAAALRSSFHPVKVGGKRIFQWKPSPTAALIGAAGLRNAQPQLFIRARERLDKALDLLDVIKPFVCDLDCEKTFESLRVVIRERIVELIEEFGRPSGPNPIRVNFIFDALFDANGEFDEFYRVSGADLIENGGKTPIINLADSANYTNLLSLVDDLKTVSGTWDTFGVYFDRSRIGEAPLGVQLSVLYDAIQGINHSLSDWLVDCDEADFDEADRLATRVADARQSMSVMQLVEWCQEATGDMGERLLQGAGLSAVKIYSKTLGEFIDWFEHLQELACESVDAGCESEDGPDSCATGLHRKKIQRGLAELICYLEDAQALCEAISPVGGKGRNVAAFEDSILASEPVAERVVQASAEPVETPARVRYILADSQLGGGEVVDYYMKQRGDDPAIDAAMGLYESGVRVKNIDQFERRAAEDGKVGIYTRRGKAADGSKMSLAGLPGDAA